MRILEVIERLSVEWGLPEVVVTENGSEFTRCAFDEWANARGVRISCIQPVNLVHVTEGNLYHHQLSCFRIAELALGAGHCHLVVSGSI